jgi:hypothetical protein
MFPSWLEGWRGTQSARLQPPPVRFSGFEPTDQPLGGRTGFGEGQGPAQPWRCLAPRVFHAPTDFRFAPNVGYRMDSRSHRRVEH